MQQLIETSEFYETIDLIITPIILANNETVCQYVNKAFLSQIGYSAQDILDQETWFNKVHPDEHYRREVKENWKLQLEEAKNKGETHVHMITKVCCADGSYKWFDIHESIHGDNKVISFLDINALQENNEELKDVLKQKDILLSIIAHDVRSPLGNLKHIVNNYKSMDLSEQETEKIFFSMGTHIDYVFNIINSLLVRTSADRGGFMEKREHIHLKNFFSKYRDYYKERMENQSIDFIFELPEGVTLYFDPFILDVICRNLIDNAIKYSPVNGDIYISFDKKNGHTDLVIRDEGPGISENQMERILNNKVSHRLKNQITDSFGLGLIMAKEILEKHDGKLGIKSGTGKGTSFVISILDK
jgi:PAS domain S-box-containing protein